MRTLLRASYMGSIAAQALSKAKPETPGEIIATFPNSFYVRTANRDLVFVTNRQLQSPITINLDSTTNLVQAAKPREPVYLLGDMIHIGESASVDFSAALRYSTKLEDARNRGFELTVDTLYVASVILGIIDTHLSVLDPAGVAYSGVRDFVADGIIPLRQTHSPESFCDAARKIIGLGAGFTPSGDDMLGGFLAAFNTFASKIGRREALIDFDYLESNTTWISAKLLDYMQRQVLDNQITRLIDATASKDGDAFIMALDTLLPRGHTSGIDIAVGIILAISLTRDILSKSNETEAIASRLGLSS